MISNPLSSAPNPVATPSQARTPLAEEPRNGHRVPTAPESRPGDSSTLRSMRGWFFTVVVLCAVAAGIWFLPAAWLARIKSAVFSTAPAGKPPVRAIPVVTAVAKKRNMDLFLNGLGTVTALKTVTIRSRVEGELISAAFSEGQMVHDGQLIAEIDDRPFIVQRDQALGQLARDKAALAIANLNLTRLNKLLPSMAVTQQAVDEQIALVKQAEGTIKSDEAMVANAELQLTYCKIVAPITGRIGLRLVDVGNIVRANDPNGLAVITQLEPIALIFTIPQDDIPRVQKRMREGHELKVDAYDRDFQIKLATGKLKAIDNQVDPTTGTLRMKAEFEKNDNVLFPNQFVNTRLLVDVRRDVIVVPSAAVQRGPSSTFVYLVKSDETVELQNIVIGPTEGAETCVESGLSAGDIVVTDGVDKLQPKSKVTTREKKSGDGKADPVKGEPGKGDSNRPAAAKVEGKSDGNVNSPNSSPSDTVKSDATSLPGAEARKSEDVKSGATPDGVKGPR